VRHLSLLSNITLTIVANEVFAPNLLTHTLSMRVANSEHDESQPAPQQASSLWAKNIVRWLSRAMLCNQDSLRAISGSATDYLQAGLDASHPGFGTTIKVNRRTMAINIIA
jgi:hypothetical protein